MQEIEGFSPDQQRFVANGQILIDWYTVDECELIEGQVIQLVIFCKCGGLSYGLNYNHFCVCPQNASQKFII